VKTRFFSLPDVLAGLQAALLAKACRMGRHRPRLI